MRNKKVGILTTFYKWDTAYSLTGVVSQQLQVLVKYGYEPVLFVLDSFKDHSSVPAGVEVRPIVPQLILEPYGTGYLPDTFEKDVERVKKAFIQHFKDIDICLTHDIIFINSFLPYNVGMRRAELPKIKWLHWMHSGPSTRPTDLEEPWSNLYTLPPRSRLIYMNYTDVIRAAEMYGAWKKDVRTVFNPMDPRAVFDLHPLTEELIEEYSLLDVDVLDIYPLSTTRMDDSGKQLSKVIKIMGYIKKQGKTVRLVVPNAHANADREKQAIGEMYQLAHEYGLFDSELIFTSLYKPPYVEDGVPHEVVMDLFRLSNLFIFPSVSENCPLVLLEAALTKNLLVLNASFPAMRDFVRENALYFNFGSLVDSPRFPLGVDRYLEDIAKIIISELNQNTALNSFNMIKHRFNYDVIFKQQLEPIFFEEDWS